MEDKNKIVDIGKFGFDIRAEKNDYSEYLLNNDNDRIYMKIYGMMKGIELYYCDIHTCGHLKGHMNEIDYYQIAYCHSGVYSSKVEEYRGINLHSGELFICKNIYSGISSSMPLGYYEGVSILFYPELMDESSHHIWNYYGIDIHTMFEALLKNKKMCRYSVDANVIAVFERLFEASKNNHQIDMRKYLIDAVLEVNRVEMEMIPNYCSVRNDTTDKINSIRRYIEENYHKHIRIEELSKVFGISSTSLKLNFKKLYGHSPYEVLKRYRMEIAAFKLRNTSDQVGKISSEVGYENPSKFSSAFQSVYGSSPKEYRKKVQTEQ